MIKLAEGKTAVRWLFALDGPSDGTGTKKKDRAIPAAVLVLCCTHGKPLCNLRNTLYRSFCGHMLLQPYIGPPPSNERRSGDHSKRNT